MAETISIDGETYVRRHAVGVAVLSVVTLGIYFFYWYYKVNDEARRYLRDETIRPGIALLAMLLGWIIIVPPFVSGYRTAGRVLRIQERSGAVAKMSPAIALILQIFIGVVYPWYVQDGLNQAWDAAGSGDAALPPPPPV
jgi:Domain of unknown function (DUF4234)